MTLTQAEAQHIVRKLGESGIPPEWLSGLAERDQLEQALRGLLG